MILQVISKLIEMIVRILWVQTEADLGLWTNMKVMLWMEMTVSTILPITLNMAIRTSYSIMVSGPLHLG